jgi:hypothetical protein
MPAATTATPTATRAAGRRVEQARYRTRDGQRGLYAQRIHGRVALFDVPIDHDARVLLIERHVESLAELEGIVAAYVEHSTQAGMPALLASRRLLDTLADQLDAQDTTPEDEEIPA